MQDLGRKYEVTDLTIELYDEAITYTRNYAGTFEFMVEMRNALQRFGDLTDGQVKGVLNCMRAEMLRSARTAPSASASAFTPRLGITEDGMYRTSDGTIYKVQFNKATGDSRKLYAKRLSVWQEFNAQTGRHDGEAHVQFEYAPGAVNKLTPADKMTLEQAKEFGALYGTCCVCGRTLTDEVSISAGIGPICAGRFSA